MIIVVAAVAWIAVRSRASRRAAVAAAPEPATLDLPEAALDRIREARDRRWETEARAEVLALGAAVDRVAIDTDSRRELWTTAQAHYVAARDVLEGASAGHGVLDVVGALVLARRGQAAVEAPACAARPRRADDVLLQPVAPGARRDDAGATTPPLCDECREASTTGGTPDTITVEGRRGKQVPYYETDAEPWASTGYGAIDDDLLGSAGPCPRR